LKGKDSVWPQLSGSTTKKVLVDRFDRQTLRGFLHPETGYGAEGVEILTPDGNVTIAPYDQIKLLSYVRDWEAPGALADRRQFLARPKAAGLWVVFHFRDGDSMEGVLPNDLLPLDGPGFAFTPPEATRNTQRVFVPRAALERLNVLGVVGSPLRSRQGARREAETRQIGLFGSLPQS
jgi:hypothetical protein